MNNYNNRGGQGGGFNKKPYGGSNDRGGRGGGGRDAARTQTLHDAQCSDCGNKTQVPFRPTGEKPVFCRDCFATKREGGNDRGGFQDKKHKDRGGNRPEFNTRTLTNPGTESSPFADMAKVKTQMEALNEKMNTIIALLSEEASSAVSVEVIKETPAKTQTEKRTKKVKTADLKETLAAIKKTKPAAKKDEKKPAVKKVVVKKAPAKKVAAKKPAAKKVAAKKPAAKKAAAKKTTKK